MYALLGGKTKDRLPVYCTTARPDIAKEMGFVGSKVCVCVCVCVCVSSYACMCVCVCVCVCAAAPRLFLWFIFRRPFPPPSPPPPRAKPTPSQMPCPYGPSAGDEGLRKNVEFFKGWREKVHASVFVCRRTSAPGALSTACPAALVDDASLPAAKPRRSARTSR